MVMDCSFAVHQGITMNRAALALLVCVEKGRPDNQPSLFLTPKTPTANPALALQVVTGRAGARKAAHSKTIPHHTTMPATFVSTPTVAPRAHRYTHRQRSSVVSSASKAPNVAPSRAVVILPGLGNAANDYASLATTLGDLGLHVTTAQVERVDWLRNAAGLTDAAYWKGTLQPRPTVDWYLNRVGAAVEDAKRATDGAPITFLAHSAGGWLARVFLLDFDRTGIDHLVSLGSPHKPPPPGVVDQTRGILTYCSDACPGAFHPQVCHMHRAHGVPTTTVRALPQIKYVTVAGKHIKGAPLTGGDGSWQQRVVGLGYAQVCGQADVWGDGVVPTVAAHLDGALNMDLEGVYHSPLGAVESGPVGRPWYGSPGVLEQWVHTLGNAALCEAQPTDAPASSLSSS